MNGIARIDLEQDLFDAAAERAAEEGLSVDAYVSLVLRRSFEREPGEDSVLVYDHAAVGPEAEIDREPGETETSHQRRSGLYGGLFGKR